MLVRLYSKPFYEQFGEGMEQTFNDLLRERAEEEKGLFGWAIWIFVETTMGIIRENMTNTIAENKRIIGILLSAALMLILPLVAMQFTGEVNWDLFDFVVMGVLLFGAGLTFEVVVRKVRKTGSDGSYRVAIGLSIATALVLVWVNGAVGLIGSEDNPANLLYGGVLFVGMIGAIIARFRPHGMARTLYATAFAQASVPVIALIIWRPSFTPVSEFLGILGVFGINTFFVMLFVGSALLFRLAVRQHN